MLYGYRYDGPPVKCNKGPRPGTVALSKGFMEHFGCGTDGIFNCRPIRVHDKNGKQIDTLSFHADGRAWDAHANGDLNKRIAAMAVLLADELGIQEVIHQRLRWDARTREEAHYGGDDPHTEHVHISQCLAAANSLTLDQVRAAIARVTTPPTPEEILVSGYSLVFITDGPDHPWWLTDGMTRRGAIHGQEGLDPSDAQELFDIGLSIPPDEKHPNQPRAAKVVSPQFLASIPVKGTG